VVEREPLDVLLVILGSVWGSGVLAFLVFDEAVRKPDDAVRRVVKVGGEMGHLLAA